MQRQRIIEAIDRAFAQAARPGTFLCDPGHCGDCNDFETALRGLTPGTVRIRDLEGPGGCPLCRVTDEAFGYFMPGLVRRAVLKPGGKALDRLLQVLEGRIDGLEARQFEAVTALIDYLYDTAPTSAPVPEE